MEQSLVNTTFTGRIRYLLVSHPAVTRFQWRPGETPCSSICFLASCTVSYVSLTLLLSRAHLPRLPPSVLRPVTSLHNLVLLTLSIVMATACALTVLSTAPSLYFVICIPPGTPPSGPLFFWAYVFYLSKLWELLDTLLILLSASAARRLTFLHVYHHATVPIMCYFCIQTSQSSFPLVLFTNSSVHVIMYSYYLFCGLGFRPRWKRLVTDCQILQFFSSFILIVLILYFHITDSAGCSGLLSWCFSLAFIASLLLLFIDFHTKSYSAKKKAY